MAEIDLPQAVRDEYAPLWDMTAEQIAALPPDAAATVLFNAKRLAQSEHPSYKQFGGEVLAKFGITRGKTIGTFNRFDSSNSLNPAGWDAANAYDAADRAANPGGSTWTNFRDMVEGGAANIAGGVGAALGSVGGPLGTMAGAAIGNKLAEYTSEGAKDYIDPGLKAVGTIAGAGIGYGMNNPTTTAGADLSPYGAGPEGTAGVLQGGGTPAADLAAYGAGAGGTAGVLGGGAGGATLGAGGAALGAGAGNTLANTLGKDEFDYTKLLDLVGPGLGYVGATEMADAQAAETQRLRELSDKYMAFGEPYRQKLTDLYADPNAFLSSDEVQKPVQMGTDMLSRSLSMGGNPVGSGNALQQLQSYSADQLFGRLGQEKDRLAGYGGLASYNAAAPQIASGATGVNPYTATQWNALGAGADTLSNIFNPKTSAMDKYWERRARAEGY